MQGNRFREKLPNLIFYFLLLFAVSGTAKAQLLNDSSAVKLLKEGISKIYNAQFRDAETILTSINTKYRGHPATFLYKAISIYYQNYPLIPFDPQFKTFEHQLQTSIQLCESQDGWINDPELLLIDFSARGLLLLCYSENEMNNEVIPIAVTTYKCVRKSFEYKFIYPDFYYFTGLYNYYREAYPEQHPFYKAIALLFPRGDKKGGLTDLFYAAENAIMLKAESYSILSWIYNYYENDYGNAVKFSRTIHEIYPNNLMFRGEYIKNLLFLRNFDEAEKLILASENVQHTYFRGQLAVFKGFLQEMKYQNYSLAGEFYEEGISDMKNFGPRGRSFMTYATDGLKRLKDIQSSKPYLEVDKGRMGEGEKRSVRVSAGVRGIDNQEY